MKGSFLEKKVHLGTTKMIILQQPRMKKAIGAVHTYAFCLRRIARGNGVHWGEGGGGRIDSLEYLPSGTYHTRTMKPPW